MTRVKRGHGCWVVLGGCDGGARQQMGVGGGTRVLVVVKGSKHHQKAAQKVQQGGRCTPPHLCPVSRHDLLRGCRSLPHGQQQHLLS